MKTTNAMQLKAKINAKAKRLNVSPQLMLQDYLLERLLVRISKSNYNQNIVLKGGMLISSLIGVDARVTKDLDTTIRGFPLTHENAKRAFREICEVPSDDDFKFEFVRTEDIREVEDYPGIRVFLKALYAPMAVPLTIDVTTGDVITPDAIQYSYQLTFDDVTIELMAYPAETVMAEKLETVISRGIATTRPRDYYDIHMLWITKRDLLNLATLKDALIATANKRGTLEQMRDYDRTMEFVLADESMQNRWVKFARSYTYAQGITLEQACEDVIEIMNGIYKK